MDSPWGWPKFFKLKACANKTIKSMMNKKRDGGKISEQLLFYYYFKIILSILTKFKWFQEVNYWPIIFPRKLQYFYMSLKQTSFPLVLSGVKHFPLGILATVEHYF